MRVQLLFVSSLAGFLAASCQAFVPSQSKVSSVVRARPSPLRALNDKKDDATIEEEARIKIYESRRMQIRAALKSAEALRNFRLEKGKNNIFDLSVQEENNSST
jgi:predicted rRNA methylase YqxC with S4 and FtsJ domains